MKCSNFLKLQTICYVCGKVIGGKIIYIGGGLHRHAQCEPGSSRWLKSPIGKKSCIRNCFLACKSLSKSQPEKATSSRAKRNT